MPKHLIPLSAQAASYDGATHEVQILASDLTETTNNTSQSIVIPTTANSATKNSTFQLVSINVKAGFSGTNVSLASLNIKVGTATNGSQITGDIQSASAHANTVDAKSGGAVTNATANIVVTVSAPGAGISLSDLDKGDIRFRIKHSPDVY